MSAEIPSSAGSALSAVDALVQQIAAAVTDLTWMSETDAPFEVLHWTCEPEDALTVTQILAIGALPATTPVEVLDLEPFLAIVTQPQDWHTVDEGCTVKRFQALQHVLQQTLQHLQVYRCGTIEIEIYIVGQATPTDWIVLHTTAIET